MRFLLFTVEKAPGIGRCRFGRTYSFCLRVSVGLTKHMEELRKNPVKEEPEEYTPYEHLRSVVEKSDFYTLEYKINVDRDILGKQSLVFDKHTPYSAIASTYGDSSSSVNSLKSWPRPTIATLQFSFVSF